MKLSELLAYDNIVIQCHNNPDADTIACGFGVYLYLKSKGKEPRLIYGGQNVIRKTNLVMLIRDLKIPIEHVDYLHKPELLVMVDCQYHSGNSAVFEAEHIAVIAHQRIGERQQLSGVRRVGQAFGITRHGCVEDHLSRYRFFKAERLAVEAAPVVED